MSTDPTINRLIRLRAELAGKINHHHEEGERAARELGHVDAVLHLMAPEIALDAIGAKPFATAVQKPRRNNRARMIREILRETPKALTVEEIAFAAADKSSMGEIDRVQLSKLMRQSESVLCRLRERGAAVAIPQEVGPQAWRLV